MSKGSYLRTLAALIIFFLSSIVLISWVVGAKPLLSLIPNGPTMKFNTALLFGVASVVLFISGRPEKLLQVLSSFLVLFIVIVSVLTLLSYGLPFNLNIDNFFFEDRITSSLPGRMSPGTAFSFLLLGLSFSCTIIPIKRVQLFSAITNQIILLISFISILSYLLLIPSENRVFFFQTMALHTSLFFLLISVTRLIINPEKSFVKLFFLNLEGSRLLKKILPLVLILPTILSFLLIYFVTQKNVTPDFGIVVYTIAFILLTLLYLSVLTVSLNKNDLVRKQLTREALATSQHLAKFKHAIETSFKTITIDHKGHIQSLNKKLISLCQFSPKELKGKPLEFLMESENISDLASFFIQNSKKEVPLVLEVSVKSKNEDIYWLSCTITPIMKNHKGEKEYIIIGQDITEQKKAQEVLNSRYVRQLEEKNRELKQFAYIASHDLQEPLRTITSFSDVLYDDYSEKLDETARMSLHFMKKATGRMSALIKGLLDYSRIGKENETTVTNLDELLHEVIDDLQSAIKQKGASVTWGEMPTLSIYRTSIYVLFQNLITNALKFCSPDKPPEIHISAWENGNYFLFSVKDNGIGMEKEDQQRIFNIFQRLHKKDEYEGTGIGLAHCKKVVNLHAGKIWVESKVGAGSTFKFTLLKM